MSKDLFEGEMTGAQGSHKDLENAYVELKELIPEYLRTHRKVTDPGEKARLVQLKKIHQKIDGDVKSIFALMLPSAEILMNAPQEPLSEETIGPVRNSLDETLKNNHMMTKSGRMRVPSLVSCKKIAATGTNDQKLALLLALKDTVNLQGILIGRRHDRQIGENADGSAVYREMARKLTAELFDGDPVQMAGNLRTVYLMHTNALRAVKGLFEQNLAGKGLTAENATQEQKDQACYEVTLTKEYEKLGALNTLIGSSLTDSRAGEKYRALEHKAHEQQADRRALDEFYNTYFSVGKLRRYDEIGSRQLEGENASEEARDYYTRMEERAAKGGFMKKNDPQAEALRGDFDTVESLTTTTEKDKKKGKKNFYNLISVPYMNLQIFNPENDPGKYMTCAMRLLSNIAVYKKEHSGTRFTDIGKDRINIVRKLEGELCGYIAGRVDVLMREYSADVIGQADTRTRAQFIRRGTLLADSVAEISALLANRAILGPVVGSDRNMSILSRNRDELWGLSMRDHLLSRKTAERLEDYEEKGELPSSLDEYLKKKAQAESLSEGGEAEDADRITGKSMIAALKLRYDYVQKEHMQKKYKLAPGLDRNNSIIPLILQRVDLDEHGDPLSPEDAAIHEANLETLRKYNSGDINDRREILENYFNRMLGYSFDVRELDPDYFMQHDHELTRKYNDVLAFQNLIHENPLNDLIFHSMHMDVQNKLRSLDAIFGTTSCAQTLAQRVFSVNQKGRVHATFETGRENYKAVADTKMQTVRTGISYLLDCRKKSLSGKQFMNYQRELLGKCLQNMPRNSYTEVVMAMMGDLCSDKKMYNHFNCLTNGETALRDQNTYCTGKTREANTRLFVQDQEQVTSAVIALRSTEKAAALLEQAEALNIRIPETKKQYALQLIANIGQIASRNELIDRTLDENTELTVQQAEPLKNEYRKNEEILNLLHEENERAGLAAVLEEAALLPENEANREEISSRIRQYTEELQELSIQENENFISRHRTEQAYANRLRLLQPGRTQKLDLWAVKHSDIQKHAGRCTLAEWKKLKQLYPHLSDGNVNRLVESLTLKPVKMSVGGSPLTREDLENYRYNRQMIARFLKNDPEEIRRIGAEVLESFKNLPDITEDMIREDYLEKNPKYLEESRMLVLCFDNLKSEMNADRKDLPGFSDALAEFMRDHPEEFDRLEQKVLRVGRFHDYLVNDNGKNHGYNPSDASGTDGEFILEGSDRDCEVTLTDRLVPMGENKTEMVYGLPSVVRMLIRGEMRVEHGMNVLVQRRPAQNQPAQEQNAQGQNAQGQQ